MSASSLDGLYHCEVKDLSPQQLIDSQIPDESVVGIWVRFKSRGGKAYTAVHVFTYLSRYILLSSSGDKDYEDFPKVAAVITYVTDGDWENRISKRRGDICDVIGLPIEVGQGSVGKMVRLYGQIFSDVKITNVYYKVPEELLPLVEAIGGEVR